VGEGYRALMALVAGWRNWVTGHPWAASVGDASVAMGAGIGSVLVTMRVNELSATPEAMPRWVAILWTVALHLPLAFRRRFPLATLSVVAVVLAGYRWWLVPEYTVSAIAMFVVFAGAGRDGAARRTGTRVAVVVLMAIVLVASFFAREYPEEFRSLFGWDLAFNLLYNSFFFGAAWLLGDALRRRAERERELEERTRQLQAERELNATRAVTEERLRIARELHDVVAHHVSVMGVQAGAARRVLGRDPGRAVDALTTVEHSSRQAVDELRRLVGFLRDEEIGGREPVPGLDRLERLVEDTRATGLDVSFRINGERADVPDSVALSVYRIVQEALTNTIKHAHARRAHVRIRFGRRFVDVIVLDDGVGIAPGPANGDGTGDGTGHGLAGMRERVALHDGRLEARPSRRGGFLVTARFPVGIRR
jgi:signal transduction histidine kinase